MIAILADPHFHNFADFSRPVECDGRPINSRLHHQLDRFRAVALEARKRGAKAIIIAGDMFHQRGIIPADVYQFVYDMLVWVTRVLGLQVYILCGNHDQMDYEGKIFSIYGLRDLATVIDTPLETEVCGVRVAFVPFYSNQGDLKHVLARGEGADLLVAHCGVDGAEVGPVEFRIKDPVRVEDLCPERYKWVLLGHYHKPQAMADNVLYVGSPWQIDRGERGDKKRWLLYNPANNEMRSIPTGARKFERVTSSMLKLAKVIPPAYYDVELEDGDTAEEIKALCPDVKIISQRKAAVKEARITVSESMSDEKLLKAYVKCKGVDPMTVDTGLQLLSKVEGGTSHTNWTVERIVIDNFLSIGHADMKIHPPGSVVALRGINHDRDAYNSNGSGKSTLLPESLNWCFFNETARELPADKVVNNKRKRDCRVTTYLRMDGNKIAVTRFRKHKKLGGTGLSITDLTNRKPLTAGTPTLTEAKLKQMLGMDYLTFSSVMAFNPESLRFVNDTDANQKHVLDSILQTRRFSLALEVAKAAVKDLRKSHSEVTEAQRTLQTFLEQRQQLYEQYNTLNNEFEKRERQRVYGLKLELETSENELERLTQQWGEVDSDLSKYKEQLKEAEDNCPDRAALTPKIAENSKQLGITIGQLKAVRADIELTQRKLDKATSLVGKPCPTCGQKLTNTGSMIVSYQQARNTLKAQEAELVKTELELMEQANQLRTEADEAREAEEKVRSIRYNVERKQKSKNSLDVMMQREKASIKRIKAEIEKVPHNDYPKLIRVTSEEITGTTHRLSEADQALFAYDHDIEEMEFWVQAFGSSGIRSFLLDLILPDLTQYANEFSEKLTGGGVVIEFATYAEGTSRDKFQVRAWNQDGSDIYKGNSSGEKRRIDLCIMLALFKIAHQRCPLNILLLDEALDGAMDEAGLENAVPLLEKLARDLKLAVYVTSHSRLLLHESVTVEKQHGIAHLV